MKTANVKRLAKFIHARHDIYVRRAAGQPPPWTTNPILRAWRFCNVYRELDKVTTWLRVNWRTPHQDDPDLWFALAVARFVNEPEVLELIGYPVPWRRDVFLEVLRTRQHAGQIMFNPAYIIVPHNTRTPKAPYVADQILTPLWHRRKTLRPAVMDTLSSYYVRLSQRRGLGSFMSAQIIADLKYVSPLDTASDWRTFAASGPGSRRGLNRILSKPARNHISEVKWRAELNTLIEKLVPYSKDLPFLLDAQDVQNVLCEFDKYERTRLGEGTPRRKFTGGDL